MEVLKGAREFEEIVNNKVTVQMGIQGEREGKEMEKLDMGEEQVPKSRWSRQSGMD